MRVIGLLSWYAESNVWLAATVASAAKCCDHIVAVDGAYALYPEGRNRSGLEQAAIIHEAAAASGMGSTVHVPPEKWEGNEVAKRSFMFRLGESVATAGDDWYMVLDADEVVLQATDVRERLEATEFDVAEVTFINREDVELKEETAQAARQFAYPDESSQAIPIFFRALPGLAVIGNHYTYRLPDGRTLWGNPSVCTQEPRLDLSDVLIEHRSNFRTIHRNEARKDYYQRRDKAAIERSLCHSCGQAGATKSVTIDWRPSGDGVSLTGQQAPVCAECYPKAEKKSRYWVRKLGFDPDGIVRGQVEMSK